MPMFHKPLMLLAAAAIGLTACGGGGGGGDSPRSVSGRILVASTAAVDSDSNDVIQLSQGGYDPNDTQGTAQPLVAPVLLAGTVNLVGFGPAGNNRDVGDAEDFFRIDLVAGQTVELEFANDPAVNDVDLYVESVDGLHIGESTGFDTRYECVRVTAASTYYVNVSAFRGASIYNLKIGAPGSAAGCLESTTADRGAPGQLLAKARPVNAEQAQALSSRLQAAGVGGAMFATKASAAPVPHLLQLPADAAARTAGLQRLAGRPVSKALAPTATATSGVASRIELLKYAKQLRATGAFEYVQPNWIDERSAIVGNFPPDDRFYSYQRWHYEQINLPAAMDRINNLSAQPSQRPIVAVIDDGVVLDHPDLAPQLFSNGRAFISRVASGDSNLPSGDNISLPEDQPAFHGSHVAGTVAAATFDGNGGAGTAPMALILPLRVFPPQGGASSVDVINAMLYAARLPNNSNQLPARRADVINMSLGGARPCDAAYQDAINRVRAAGVIVVVAAGNSGRNNIGQRAPVGSPANCSGAIAVSALDAQKGISPYSNTGTQITVAAPGGDASQSTTGTGAPDNVYSDIATFNGRTRVPSFGGMQGTSMAAPHVAGVMALMRYLNKDITVAQVDTLIADGDLTDDLGSAGRDIDYGHGLINAAKAVEAALGTVTNPPQPTPGRVTASPSLIDFGTFQSSATLELTDGTGTESVVSVISDNAAVRADPVTVDAGGRGRYTVTVNRAGLGAGSIFPKLTVTLSPARTITVQLSVTTPAAGGGTTGNGNFGPMYVLLVDPATQNVVQTVIAQRAAGGYTWSANGITLAQVAVVAGGDLDNDDIICQRGEPCGAYPVYEPGQVLSLVDLSGDRSDIDFQVAPLSGMSVLGAGAGRPLTLRRTQVRP